MLRKNQEEYGKKSLRNKDLVYSVKNGQDLVNSEKNGQDLVYSEKMAKI